jgi:hypothetical protein
LIVSIRIEGRNVVGEVVKLRNHQEPKKPQNRSLMPWNRPRTIRNVSQEGLLLLSFAIGGFLAERAHFTIVPLLCIFACFILCADLMYLALRSEDAVTGSRSSNDSPSDAA